MNRYHCNCKKEPSDKDDFQCGCGLDLSSDDLTEYDITIPCPGGRTIQFLFVHSPRYIHCSFVMFDTLSHYVTTSFSLKMHRPVKVLLCWTDRRMASKVRHLTSLSSALHQIMAETENVKLLVQLFCNSQNAEYSFILTTISITQIVFNPRNNHQPYKLEASSLFA